MLLQLPLHFLLRWRRPSLRLNVHVDLQSQILAHHLRLRYQLRQLQPQVPLRRKNPADVLTLLALSQRVLQQHRTVLQLRVFRLAMQSCLQLHDLLLQLEDLLLSQLQLPAQRLVLRFNLLHIVLELTDLLLGMLLGLLEGVHLLLELGHFLSQLAVLVLDLLARLHRFAVLLLLLQGLGELVLKGFNVFVQLGVLQDLPLRMLVGAPQLPNDVLVDLLLLLEIVLQLLHDFLSLVDQLILMANELHHISDRADLRELIELVQVFGRLLDLLGLRVDLGLHEFDSFGVLLLLLLFVELHGLDLLLQLGVLEFKFLEFFDDILGVRGLLVGRFLLDHFGQHHLGLLLQTHHDRDKLLRVLRLNEALQEVRDHLYNGLLVLIFGYLYVIWLILAFQLFLHHFPAFLQGLELKRPVVPLDNVQFSMKAKIYGGGRDTSGSGIGRWEARWPSPRATQFWD